MPRSDPSDTKQQLYLYYLNFVKMVLEFPQKSLIKTRKKKYNSWYIVLTIEILAYLIILIKCKIIISSNIILVIISRNWKVVQKYTLMIKKYKNSLYNLIVGISILKEHVLLINLFAAFEIVLAFITRHLKYLNFVN